MIEINNVSFSRGKKSVLTNFSATFNTGEAVLKVAEKLVSTDFLPRLNETLLISIMAHPRCSF